MSDLRDGKRRSTLVLRSFRAVRDGPSFCWDLFLVERGGGDDAPVDLPDWMQRLQHAVDESEDGAPAISIEKNLADPVFVTLERQADGDLEAVLADHPGWLRWVKLRAAEGRTSLEWCVRIEGGAELGTPIAEAWEAKCQVLCTSAQGDMFAKDEEPAPAKPKGRGKRTKDEPAATAREI